MKNQKKEPEIKILETGSIPADQLPEGEMPIKQEQQPKTRSVKDVLAEDVLIIRGMNFTMDEAEKFMPVFHKIKQDMIDCVMAIEKEEQKHKGGEKHADADPE